MELITSSESNSRFIEDRLCELFKMNYYIAIWENEHIFIYYSISDYYASTFR